MLCPLHRLPVLAGQGDTCAACDRLGLVVLTCELDKVGRTIDTLQEQGYEVDLHRSHAVIVHAKEPQGTPMMLEVQVSPTPEFVKLNGVRCRLWKGATADGAPVDLYVLRAGSASPTAQAELERALIEMPPPAEEFAAGG